jgi:hypothetical protein
MSQTTTDATDVDAPLMAPDWRQRMRRIGKDAFIREEMTRLGFWPPSPEAAASAAEAEAQLRQLYEELANVRSELRGVEGEIAQAGDVPALLAEIRRRRIERVRAARAVKREQKAKERETKRAQDREWRQKTLPFLGHGVSAGLRYGRKRGMRRRSPRSACRRSRRLRNWQPRLVLTSGSWRG